MLSAPPAVLDRRSDCVRRMCLRTRPSRISGSATQDSDRPSFPNADRSAATLVNNDLSRGVPL